MRNKIIAGLIALLPLGGCDFEDPIKPVEHICDYCHTDADCPADEYCGEVLIKDSGYALVCIDPEENITAHYCDTGRLNDW